MDKLCDYPSLQFSHLSPLLTLIVIIIIYNKSMCTYTYTHPSFLLCTLGQDKYKHGCIQLYIDMLLDRMCFHKIICNRVLSIQVSKHISTRLNYNLYKYDIF